MAASKLDAIVRELGRGSRTSSAKRPARTTVVHECPRSGGLCKVCGWSGKRVPTAWLEQEAGTPYDGASKLLGTRVRLRGDDVDSVVVGLATPLGGSLLQGARSKGYRCQGSFIVRTPFGAGSIETPVAKSVVRERRRVREGNCPDAPVYRSGAELHGVVREMDRDAARQGRHPFDLVAELPYPHRKGGSPCCVNSKLHPDKLEGLIADWRETGEERDFERAVAGVRKALPQPERATMTLASAKQLERGVRAVKDHCWGQWLTAEERAQETKKQYRARRKDAAEERRAQGLDSGRRFYRERRTATPAFEGQSDELAQTIADFKTWAPEALPVDFDVEDF